MFVSSNSYRNMVPVIPQRKNIKKDGAYETPSANTSSSTKAYSHPTTLYLKKPDMIYSGGNAAGVSFYIKYAEESTEDNPVVKATGIDEKGESFEQTIALNDIDPSNATYVEMRALEAHNKVPYGIMSTTSLPLDCNKMKLNDRIDFFELFEKDIQNYKNCGRYDLAAIQSKCYQTYLDINDRKKDY
ncbi:hypothetical protein [Lacrimispora sp. JR3]|uniref:hypothetical protein n=1 Tax=Lacrimispora sinapis TaxID=3111456 RepID=UPI00374869CA